MATAPRATAIDDDDLSPAAFSDDGGSAGDATAIEDLPADVLALVLRRLDGASLAALGCASSAFHGLASDPDAWRDLCLAQWPSVRDALPLLHGDKGYDYRQLFADAFPFPSSRSPAPAPSSATTASPEPLPLPARLVSAVDLYYAGASIMSRVVETDTSSAWFLGSPFRVDALVQEAFTAPSAPITPSELTLSWVLVDPDSGRAVNASSRRPVAVERRWLTGETVVRFALVLAGAGVAGGGEAVALDAAVTCDERYGHVREVSLCVEDGGVSGRDGLAVVAAAMAGARRGRGAEAEAAKAKLRYEEFVRRRNAMKERKTRRDGIVDLCCSGVGAAAFLGFLVMLTFR